ncbi:S8 family serine peptidase [Paenibacillus polymyxa]|uniref:S8 family serine peptidase n=1 Tax=Paenibacillus polymyxa TaxID=1406 RepID=UPI0003169222|nr:S8 family serine peptidase [Paenibacillus polymyxa]NMP09049.1 S8 family serine peptidase [Paenibacillus polymyxa]QDA27621.1 peptidase s8 and s53 subtilisin kexin sedolisin [Paenibacillus polymyxa]RTZ32920.1 peptidase s8 and s53 subtilisin kexin sedolisin [Paenibacillus polymyxa]
MEHYNQVAIIDTGMDMTNRSLSKHVIDGVRFQFSGNEIIEDNDFQDDHGHGTSVADTIMQVFSEAQFYIIKIANEEGKTSTRLLQMALKKCLNLNIKYICISISVTLEGYHQQLSEITHQLVDQNKLIFVSVKNGSQSSYPASLPTVIGVNGQMFCSIGSFLFSKNKKIQAVFDEAPIFVYTLAERFTFFKGTSKANALCVGRSMQLISSEVTNSVFYNEDITFSEVNDILERSALEYEVTVPKFKPILDADIDSNLVKKFGKSIEKAIYETTNLEIDIHTLYKVPFICELTGITFKNFDYFWNILEKELNHTLNDYHNIHILNVCSLAALLKYLEELGI